MKQKENPTTQEMGAPVEDALSVIKDNPQKNVGGRPSEYTEERGNLICDLLAQGISLRKICKLEDMPHFVTVFRWIDSFEEFRNQYRIARDVQADYFMDEIIDISDDSSDDDIFTEDGRRCLNSEFVQRSKLRIDARKWAASKIAPKKYGDKIEQAITGSLTIEVVKFGKDKTAE